jgi:uncharacterized membrane protein
MDSQAFSDGAILHAAWQRTKDRLGFFVILGIVIALFFVVSTVLIAFIASESTWGGVVAQIVYYVLSLLVGIGLIKITLDVSDGKEGALVDLVSHAGLLLKYIGATIAYAFVVYVGLFLFVIPGVIWTLKFFFTPWFVVDKGMGPISAMKASSRITAGKKWDLLGFLAAGYTVLFLGALVLGIGLIVTGPCFAIATAMVYRHLSKGVDVSDLMGSKAPAAVAPTV